MTTSFKDELYDSLKGLGVKYIEVDRNAELNGLPAILVKVFEDGFVTPHEFTFSKANKMEAPAISDVIKSYLRR